MNVKLGQSWSTMSTMLCLHPPWSTKANHGQSWPTKSSHVLPCTTIIPHGQPWSAKLNYGQPSLAMSTMVNEGQA